MSRGDESRADVSTSDRLGPIVIPINAPPPGAVFGWLERSPEVRLRYALWKAEAPRQAGVRSIVVLPFWAAFVWLVAPVVEMFPFDPFAMGGVALIFIVPGVAIGHVISRRLNDIAGCQSLLFTALAAAFEVAIAIGGVKIAEIWRPMPNWGGFVAMCATLYAALWTLRNTHFSD